jgi:hypothetical protein
MTFSRKPQAAATQRCSSPCCDSKARDDRLEATARARADVLLKRPPQGSPCQAQAKQISGVADRFGRYRDALPAARASQHLNELDSGPSRQPCLTPLSTDADTLNRQLGIPPGPGAIKPADLRNDETGYRAAMYRDETTGRNILIQRDTQPTSLEDWRTNIDNGQGKDTEQYRSARVLAGKLQSNNVAFDIGGYSKGGGLAQEAGLVSRGSQVYVFNSSGLHPASLARTGQSDFGSLVARTQSFSAEGDFLTYMNNGTSHAEQVANATYLRDRLRGGNWGPDPLEIDHRNPAFPDGSKDPAFPQARQTFLNQMDQLLARRIAKPGGAPLFPPVRAATHETIPNSMSTIGKAAGARSNEPNLGKLWQHKVTNVVGPMEKSVEADRTTLNNFVNRCG